MRRKITKLFSHSSRSPLTGSYKIEVLSLPEECDSDDFLPFEIRFIFKTYPEYRAKIRTILTQGKAIGVRTVLRTPENILKAVHTISVHSQKNYIITWLPALLRDKHIPHITPEDHSQARRHGEDLDEAVDVIMRDRLRFKRLVLIDEENKGIHPNEQRLMTELSELIYPLAIDYSVFRVIADNARERTKVAQTIVKALLIVGPVAHVLEKYAAGIGKVFAASADDLLGESAELMALRGSGFTWRELIKRSRILIPVFALATWGAFSVEGLLEEGHILLGGAVFGLSAVALSLTTALQSILMYTTGVKKLAQENKTRTVTSWEYIKIAIIQDFTNPARLGLLCGAVLAPVMGMIGAITGYMHNGWILAAIGSTESIVAGLTVIFAGPLNEWRFKRKLTKAHLRRV